MLTFEQEMNPLAWSFAEACTAVDQRDWFKSAMSGVNMGASPSGSYSRHHRKLRSRGGDNSPANLVLVSGSGTTDEHGWIHANPALATLLGYMVPSGADPAEVPIWRLGPFGQQYGWFLQSVDGRELTACAPPADPLHELGDALHRFEELVIGQRITARRWD